MNILKNLLVTYYSSCNRDTIETNSLNQSLERFLETGLKEDAFIVYYCFCEIFHIFGNGYENAKKLLDLLSDHEYHSGELLTKHRDHYSHSVYVFALGLAIFANDKSYREAFIKFYNLSEEEAEIEFLKYWGLTSLFHDIGYPFQLAHEQIKSYCQEIWGNDKTNPYVSFGNFQSFVTISDEHALRLKDELNLDFIPSDINSLLAYGVCKRMEYDCEEVTDRLYKRIVAQPDFMDHGYFSSLLLIKQLINNSEFRWNTLTLDVLSAILLHNSFNKYEAPDKRPVKLEEHPLAYLLILCDELQNWDRLAFGKVSKRDPIAWDIRLEISDHHIKIEYLFDNLYVIGANGEKRINKSYAEIKSGEFVAKILGGEVNGKSYEGFINSDLQITASAEQKVKEKKTHSFASDNNIINLYDFGVAIHASYSQLTSESPEALNQEFGRLPLEFKVSNILMAKSYAEKLKKINCFYSGRDLDYPLIEDFEYDEMGNKTDALEHLSREEHVRWVKEKIKMGWKYGEHGKDFSTLKERNAKKLHDCLVPYDILSEEDKQKDVLMIKNIIPMLKRVGNNLRVYRFYGGNRPTLTVSGIGHRYFSGDVTTIRKQIKSYLNDLSNKYNVIVQTSFAYGADQLIAEIALDMGLLVRAILPLQYEEFIAYVKEDALKNGISYTDEDEMHLRLLLAQTYECKYIKDFDGNIFEETARQIISQCDKLIALWDGIKLPLEDTDGKPINRGGTYDGICKAQAHGLTSESIYIIPTIPRRK